MSSFEETLGKLVNKTVDSVEGFVNQTADHVSDFLKNNTGLIKQSSTASNSTMGSTTSKTSHSTSTTTSSLVPPFSVAYGVNSAGKTLLYPIDVTREFPGRNQGEISVGDLQNHLANLTQVPVECQTLIHKGTHLRSDILLANLKIRDGAKIMMLGKAPPDPDEKYKKALSVLEDEISVVSMQVMEAEMQLENGGHITPDALKALHKQFLRINEHFMKVLMKVDAVEIPSDRTAARAARKAVVVRVHKEMEAVDNLVLKCCPMQTGNADQQVVLHDSR